MAQSVCEGQKTTNSSLCHVLGFPVLHTDLYYVYKLKELLETALSCRPLFSPQLLQYMIIVYFTHLTLPTNREV